MGAPSKEYDFSRTPDINNVLIDIDREYGPRLRKFIAQNLGPSEVDDIYQTVLIRVAIHYHKFDPERAPFQSWIYRITSNLIKNAFRNNAKRKIISIHDSLGVGSEQTLEDMLESPPDNSVDPEEAEAFFNARVAQLPPQQREALYLQLMQGKNYREIEAAQGVENGTVKSRRNRGLAEAFPEQLQARRRAVGE